MNGQIKDLKNKNFGRWKVISFSRTKKLGDYSYQMWNCICECGSKKVVDGKSLKDGNSVSCGCYNREKTPRGKEHYRWQEKGLSYQGIHKWLRKTLGSANKCENKDCQNITKFFEWALIKGKKYERKRENFKQLCRSCHRKYDYTEETRRKHQNQIPWNKGLKMKKL